MAEVVGSDFEIDSSSERPEGFNLRCMKGRRADEDAERGFDALSKAVKRFVPATGVGHVFALGCNDAWCAEISSVADDGCPDACDKLRGDARLVVVSPRTGKARP